MKSRTLLWILLFFAPPLFLPVRSAYPEFPSERKRAWEISEEPGAPLEGESPEDLFQIVQEGEAVFTARIESAAVRDVGIQVPVPLTLVTLKEIQPLKGKAPRAKTFRYPKPPETLRIRRGARVLVVLTRASSQPKTLQIAALVEATKTNLDLARLASETTG